MGPGEVFVIRHREQIRQHQDESEALLSVASFFWLDGPDI